MTRTTGGRPEPGTAATPDPGRPWARASLILGVVGIVLSPIPLVGLVSYLLGAVGIAAGFVGRAGAARASNASLGAIGIALCIVAIFSATFWQVLYAILG